MSIKQKHYKNSIAASFIESAKTMRFALKIVGIYGCDKKVSDCFNRHMRWNAKNGMVHAGIAAQHDTP